MIYRHLRFLVLIAVSIGCLTAADDPRYTSWLLSPSGTYARLYESSAAQTSGSASTTWSRGSGIQSSPAYAGVTQVSYSSNWVYLRTTGLGFHVMGPWYLDAAKAQNFPSFPSNTNSLYRIPRTPTVPATKTLTNTGAIGYFVDGVAMFDFTDTFSYSNSGKADPGPASNVMGMGDGVWNRDAYVNEGLTFDPAFAHQAGNQYHYHANAPALRYELGDHVDYSSTTKLYTESATTPTKHSPILGWARDGYPVYGPYGYATANDATSGVRRMISGYVKRDGSNGTTNLNSTGRTTLPTWALTAQNRSSAALTSAQSGPAVSATYTLGHYLEDYDYLGNLGKTQGTDFDLDLYNGRFGITPEFPNGTYAYFISVESDGTPKYPYIIGRWFYGSPTGTAVTSISETVTEYVRGAPTAALLISTVANGSNVTVAWNSVEGATYTIASSADQLTWTTLSSTVASAGLTTAYSAPTASYYRVTLSAIATYDTNGTVGTPVGTTATVSYQTTTISGAPTIATAPASLSVVVGSTAFFTVTANGNAPLSYQWTKAGTAISGATNATYTIAAAATADAGSYAVTVTNTVGSVTSSASLTVTTADTGTGTSGTDTGAPPDMGTGPGAGMAPPARIINLSTRTAVGGVAGTPVMGLVVGGEGSQAVLLRAVGPTLASFGITSPLADPQINLLTSATNTSAASNDDWGTSTNLTALTTATSAVGAFSLTSGSKDAAWFGTLATGSYTLPVLDDRGSGITLLEAYDASTGPGTARIINASTRAYVGTGDSVLITGFVIAGDGNARVLLRAVGPTLASYGVSGALTDPTMTLYSGSTVMASNDNWSANATALAAAATTAGAFALPTDSADAALLVDLPAGAYTVVITGVGTATGTALVEVYTVN